jgi:hypothetical protein
MLDASIVATRIHGFERGLVNPAAEAAIFVTASDGDFIRVSGQSNTIGPAGNVWSIADYRTKREADSEGERPTERQPRLQSSRRHLAGVFPRGSIYNNRWLYAGATPADLPQFGRMYLVNFQKKKARGEAGLWGRKALGPMRGWPQNSFLSGSLEAALLQVKKESYKRSCL